MGFNPNNERDISRLRQSMEFSARRLYKRRLQRMDALREYIGFNHGESGTTDRRAMPFIELATNIYQRQIASNSPRAHISTYDTEFAPDAYELQLALDDVMKRINLEGTLNDAGVEALFSMGVVKVGLVADGTASDQGGFLHVRDLPFAEPVLFEDFIFDVPAKRWEQIQYCGDINRVSLEWAKDNKLFDKDVREDLTATHRLESQALFGNYREVRSQLLSAGMQQFDDEIEDQVEIWELWVPSEKLIVTLSASPSNNKPLRVMEWEGPDHGPYHLLRFEAIPGSILPLAPVSLWMDLHVLTNQIFNKLARGAIDTKTVLGFSGPSGERDAETIMRAEHQDTVHMADPNSVREFNFNGPDQRLFGMIPALRDFFVYYAGNLDAIGGLSAQSQTVGQDKLLLESASQRIQDMQKRMASFTETIMEDIAGYLWKNGNYKRKLMKSVEGTSISFPFEFDPTKLRGELADYNVRIEPYSLRAKTPTERAAGLKQIVTEMLMPMQPILQANGVTLDVAKLLKLLARYGDMPELNEILTYATEDAKTPEDSPTMKPPTHSIYERVNRPAGTRQGKDQAMAMALMGVDQQPAEMARIVR